MGWRGSIGWGTHLKKTLCAHTFAKDPGKKRNHTHRNHNYPTTEIPLQGEKAFIDELE